MTAPLPSPRTREQGLRDMMQNAIALMGLDELTLVHSHIGPYCLEKLLDSTMPGAAPAAPAPETPDPAPSPVSKKTTRNSVPAKPLWARLKARFDALGIAWDTDSIASATGVSGYRLGRFVTGDLETIGATTAGRIEAYLLEEIISDDGR